MVTDEDLMGDEHAVRVKDHLGKDHDDCCGYCGQFFVPDEMVIEKTIIGRKWKFCSEDCYRDFKDASDFKDEDLDAVDLPDTEDPADDIDDDKL